MPDDQKQDNNSNINQLSQIFELPVLKILSLQVYQREILLVWLQGSR